MGGVDIRIDFSADGKPLIPDPAKEYDLGYGHLGHGITVWNRAEERNGDYVTVAHIRTDRSVRFYDENMPNDLKAHIERVSRRDVSLGERPAPKKPATLREKMANAGQKAKEYNAARQDSHGTPPKKRCERE